MSAPETLDLFQLEDEITNLCGTSRAQFHPNDVKSDLRPYLRAWIIKSGGHENKVWAATDTVLANAYRVGFSYISKMNDSDNDKRFRGPSKGGVKLDGFGTKLDPELLGVKAKPGSYEWEREQVKKDSNSMIKLSPDTPTPEGITGEKLAQMLGRAADLVIPPKIEAATQELIRQVESQLPAAIRREIGLKFNSEEVQEQVQEIAASTARELANQGVQDAISAARKIVEENLPRRIELKNGHTTTILDAKPRHRVFDSCLKWLHRGKHIYLVGPAGTGKTFLFHQLGEALARPVTVLGQAFSKYDFSGFTSPTGQYIATQLRVAVEEGHLLGLDEIDMSAAPAIGFLNSLLANRYVAFPDKVVEAHKDFVCIAAANTYGRGADQDYIGRNPLDAASLDRFVYTVCDYDEALEKQIFGDTNWTKYVHRVRKAVSDLRLRHVVSMRALERGIDGIEIGLSADEVCDSALWRGLDKDSIDKIRNLAGTFQLETKSGFIPRGKTKLDQFLIAISDNKKVDAIKIYREIYSTPSFGFGLKEAKDEVDYIMSGMKPPPTYDDNSAWRASV